MSQDAVTVGDPSQLETASFREPDQVVEANIGAPVAPTQTLAARRRSRMYIPSVSAKARAMTRSTVFTTNRSQAVRLPKPVALPEGVRQVEIVKLGRSRLISPAGHSWGFRGHLTKLSITLRRVPRRSPAGNAASAVRPVSA